MSPHRSDSGTGPRIVYGVTVARLSPTTVLTLFGVGCTFVCYQLAFMKVGEQLDQ